MTFHSVDDGNSGRLQGKVVSNNPFKNELET